MKLSRLIKNISFEIFVCKNCHISFTSPFPTVPEYENMDFHSKNQINNTENLISYDCLPFDWRKLIDLQVELTSKYLPLDAFILEIGCGEGILLDLLKNKGFLNVEGVEPSYTASKRATKKGLTVDNSYFIASKVHRKYDLVIMSHVLEHIEDPVQLLKDINSILKSQGALLLTQTNYKGLIPKIQGDRWYAWVPDQHFWHFTPKSLKNIFQQTGFNILNLNYSSLVHPNNILTRVAKLIPFLQDQFILFATKNKV